MPILPRKQIISAVSQHYKCLYSLPPDCKSGGTGICNAKLFQCIFFIFSITNAYIHFRRIANPAERGVRLFSCIAITFVSDIFLFIFFFGLTPDFVFSNRTRSPTDGASTRPWGRGPADGAASAI